ncbi:MAG: 2-oxo acid dehydrogenase subunit E2 [Lentisphaerae bacterium]|nr:2-oxo acid dehydrogenase subunit E2 [Lentisphaerota bacterium]
MAQIVIMPKLGQTVEESTIIKWHKQAGDTIVKGDILFEIETDKAVLEVESFFEGTLLKIIVPEGVSVPVTTPVAFIGKPGEPLPELPPRPTPIEEAVGAHPASPAAAARPTVREQASAPPPAEPPPLKKIFSPRARRLLKELPINPEPIRGSGPGGRVIHKDVLAYLDTQGYHDLHITPAAKALALKEEIDILSLPRSSERLSVATIEQAVAEKPRALSAMRQVIAQRLTKSFTSTPHFYVTVTVDMTELLEFRKQLKQAGQAYSLTDFIVKSTAQALRKFPALNSTTDGRQVRWHSRVHVGLAVEVPDGLVVPVIRDADTISLHELHARGAALILKAREGRLMPDEMSASTFTISNMGMLNVDHFTAIINPGESAILAIASIRQVPLVLKKAVVIRSVMAMTLSADHRLVDGATAARFINHIKSQLENSDLWQNMISS